LHIGCNKYGILKQSHLLKDVFESYNDVKKYADFFENALNYHKVIQLTDETKINQINLRETIINKTNNML